jgi:rhodanese-related sulfurtransferase
VEGKIDLDFEIKPEEVKRQLDAGEQFTLLDVREPWEFVTASIAGSTQIPMDQIPMRIQELDPDEHIIVMCHHGVRSATVASWLQQQGFTKVQSMRGGINLWSHMVDPKVPVY